MEKETLRTIIFYILFLIGIIVICFFINSLRASASEYPGNIHDISLYLERPRSLAEDNEDLIIFSDNSLGANTSPFFIGEVKIPERDYQWERIIACESGGDFTAKNPNSSAYGYCQMIDSTWDECMEKWGLNLNRDNPNDQVYACERLYREDGVVHWLASQECWDI